MTTESVESEQPVRKGIRWTHVLLIMLIMMLVTIGVTVWIVKSYLFPGEFTPVTLSQREQRVLETKLENLESVRTDRNRPGTGTKPLEPEAYSEVGANREIRLSEREVNALLANNTDLARKLAIDLSDDLVSARLLVPVDPDFPIMGGKILKVRAGAEIAYRNNKPVVILKGISIMGVPLPNAWIGGLKNIDLIQEFGEQHGFWKSFAEGVDNISVRDGHLYIKLRE